MVKTKNGHLKMRNGHKLNQNTLIEGKSAYWAICIVMLLMLVASVITAVSVGTVRLEISEVVKVVLYKMFRIGDSALYGEGPVHDIVWLMRFPRAILAVGVGIGLSLVGIVMQAIVKNPLADPYILGVSSGASLGATAGILLGVGRLFGANGVSLCAFIGAFAISILVQFISNIGGRASSTKLLLAGMALNSVCSAFSSAIVYFSSNLEGIKTISFWTMGSLAGADWKVLWVLMPVVLIGALFFVSQSRTLNLMLLGDEAAITLGTDLHGFRMIYLLFSSVIIGVVVYASGMIGFVGLLIPHICRMFCGTDHKRLIPVSCLVGAIFLVWSDLFSRVIIPSNELPIGILISMIGSPFFVYMMVRRTYGFGGN